MNENRGNCGQSYAVKSPWRACYSSGGREVVPSSPAFSDTEYLKGVRRGAVARKAKKSPFLVGTQIFDFGCTSGNILSGRTLGPTSGCDFRPSEFRAPSLPPAVALGPAGSSYFRQESPAAGTWKPARKRLPASPLRSLTQARSPACGGSWACRGASLPA